MVLHLFAGPPREDGLESALRTLGSYGAVELDIKHRDAAHEAKHRAHEAAREVADGKAREEARKSFDETVEDLSEVRARRRLPRRRVAAARASRRRLAAAPIAHAAPRRTRIGPAHA